MAATANSPPRPAPLPLPEEDQAAYGRTATGYADLRGPTWMYPSRATHRPHAQSYYRRLPNQDVAMSAVLSPKPTMVRRTYPPDAFEAFRRYRCYPHKSDDRFDAFLARVGLRLPPAPARAPKHGEDVPVVVSTPYSPMDDPAPFEQVVPMGGLYTAECAAVGGDAGENAKSYDLIRARFPELKAIFYAYSRLREIQPLERVVRGERVWAMNRLEFLMLLRDCRLLDGGRNTAATADNLFGLAARSLRGVEPKMVESGPPAPDGKVALTLSEFLITLVRLAQQRFGDQRILSMSDRVERLLRDWIVPRAKRDRVRDLRRAIAREPCHTLLKRARPFLSAVFQRYRGADAFTRDRTDDRMSAREFARLLVEGALMGPLPRLGHKESLDLFTLCLCNTAQEMSRLGEVDDDKPLMGLGEFTEALCRAAELRRSRAFDSFEDEPLDVLIAKLLTELHATLTRGVPGLEDLPRPPEPPATAASAAAGLTLPALAPTTSSSGGLPKITSPASAGGLQAAPARPAGAAAGAASPPAPAAGTPRGAGPPQSAGELPRIA